MTPLLLRQWLSKPMDHPPIHYENLVHAFAHDLFCYGYWLCQDRAFAEVLVQDTFARATDCYHQFHDRQDARFWLFSQVRRDALKTLAVIGGLPPPVLPPIPPRFASDLAAFQTVLRLFPLGYRELLVLQMLGGFLPQEIAQLTDQPLATVTQRLTHSRRWLRDWLSQTSSFVRQGETR